MGDHPSNARSCRSSAGSIARSTLSRRRAGLFAAAATALTGAGHLAHACVQDLAPPVSEVLLVVRGTIGRCNTAVEAHLDRALLEAMGVATLTTWTPWTDGELVFEGVLLRSVVEQLDAGGEAMRARALNDYHVEIPILDAVEHDVLIAWSADGVALSRRDKGPLWVVYPWSSEPALDNRNTNQRSIWQLYELEFHD